MEGNIRVAKAADPCSDVLARLERNQRKFDDPDIHGAEVARDGNLEKIVSGMSVLSFEEFELDLRTHELRRGGHEISLQPKAMRLLAYLAEHHDRVVPKRELLDAFWPEEQVVPAALTSAIRTIRRALGENRDHRYIRTVHGVGYRFVASVRNGHSVPTEEQSSLVLDRTLVSDQTSLPGRRLADRRLADRGLASQGLASDESLVIDTDDLSHDSDPFVGRSRELQELWRGYRRAQRGEPGWVMLCGEAGIGKTRTVWEFSRELERIGAFVHWGHCPEEPGAPAYWPWRQVLSGVAHHAGGLDKARKLGLDLAVVERISQFLGSQTPSEPAAEGESDRFYLFASVSMFLRAPSHGQQRHVIVLEDLHFADPSSLALLKFLATEQRGSGLMVVGTYRPSEVTAASAEASSLAGATRFAERIQLAALSNEDVRQLVSTRFGHPSTDAAVDHLCDVTDGNPLFLRELLRIPEVESALLGAEWPSRLRLPVGVEEAVRRRLDPLTDVARSVLDAASVLGRRFDAFLLETLCEDSDSIANALEEATAVGIVVPASSSGLGNRGRYRFSHALVQHVVYSGQDSTTRARFHIHAARALQRMHRDRPGPVLGQIARHFSAAARPGQARDAINAAIRAAEHATSLLGFEEASEWYSVALEHLRLEDASERECGAVLVALGDVLFRAGDAGAQDALTRAARLGDEIGDGELLATAVDRLGDVLVEIGTVQSDLVAWLRRAIEHLDVQDSPLRVRLMSRLAKAFYFAADAHKGRALSAEALAMARRLGDPRTLSAALLRHHFVIWDADSVEERLIIADEAARIANDGGVIVDALESRAWQIQNRLELGSAQELGPAVELYAKLAAEARLPRFQWRATLMRGAVAMMEGRLADGEACVQSSVQTARDADLRNIWTFHIAQVFTLRREQMRLTEVEPMVTDIARRPGALVILRAGVTLMQLELGQVDSAQREFESLADRDFTDIPRDGNWLPTMVMLAEVSVGLSDQRRAAQIEQLLAPYGDRVVVMTTLAACLGSTWRYLALLSGLLNRGDAKERFERAIDANRALGADLYVAHAQTEYAEWLTRQGGDDATADSLRAQSHTTAERLELKRLLE